MKLLFALCLCLVYPNNLKAVNSCKEAPQNFCPEPVTIAAGQGTSEDKYSEIVPDDLLIHTDFYQICDIAYDINQPFNPNEVFEGALVNVPSKYLPYFFIKHFPHIPNRFILISRGDSPSPGPFSSCLESPKLIAWLGQNATIKNHKKFFPVPIGLRTPIATQFFNSEIEKEYLLYMNIPVKTHNSNILKEIERKKLIKMFSGKDYCYYSDIKPFEDYLTDLKKSYFVLSPRGNGIDCHRTYETIAMGSIPIVKSSCLDALFEDLPVLIVNDWNEINKEFLETKYIEIRNKKVNYEKIYFSYWKRLIQELLTD